MSLPARAAEHDMVFTGVLEVVGIRTGRRRVIADDQRRDLAPGRSPGLDGDAACRRSELSSGSARPSSPSVELLGRIDLEDQRRRREDVGRKMRGVGVRHHQFGERVLLELGAEVQARGARQVVEAVAALQVLELGLEHEIEGRAQHAAERHDLPRRGRRPRGRRCRGRWWSRRQGPWHAVCPACWPRCRCCTGNRGGRLGDAVDRHAVDVIAIAKTSSSPPASPRACRRRDRAACVP